MKKIYFVVGLGIIGAAIWDYAHAQTAPAQPAYAPFTIDQKTYESINSYLGDVPSKWSVPLLNAFAQLEQRAQMEAQIKARTEAKPKADAPVSHAPMPKPKPPAQK